MGLLPFSICFGPESSDTAIRTTVLSKPERLKAPPTLPIRREEEEDGCTFQEEADVTLHSSTDAGRVYQDVWYRYFLKPFVSFNHSVPFHETFRRRILQPVGIPVAEVNGLHEMFKPQFCRYSPLMGMIFTYNNFIDNLYRYGDPDEPAVTLIQSLFHALPGGEIQATHLGKCAGAHLSPGIIGVLFEMYEHLVAELKERSVEDGKKILANAYFGVITDHPDYKESQNYLADDVRAAESALEALNRREAQSKPVREKIKSLEGDVIKICRHKIKRAEMELAKNNSDEKCQQLHDDLAAQHEIMEVTKSQVKALREQIVTSLEFKTARKALRRAHEMVDLEKDSRTKLSESLASSFMAYELESSRRSVTLPKFTTTIVLLAYVWRKYHNIQCLKEYFESMARLGALTYSVSAALALINERAAGSAGSACINLEPANVCCGSRRRMDWSPHEKENAAAIVISKPGVARRPPLVSFSYVSWASYSEFPDCGETSLRNLFNQILYNPASGLYDHALLCELRNLYYPRLDQKLIDFYTKFPHPLDASDHAVSRAWINVVSNLNNGRDGDLKIRYRREKQQQNIASPLSNVLFVFNALFGIRPLDEVSVDEVVGHINQTRDWNIQVDTSRIKKDGFGTMGLTVGNVRYELQSYKPVHFAFVQMETLELDASGRHDFNEFGRLMQYSCEAPTLHNDDPSYFEQLALASLFVPYEQRRMKHCRFFDSCPAHYCVLFADIHNSTFQESVIQWAKSRHPDDPQLNGIADRIRKYVEPTFLPT